MDYKSKKRVPDDVIYGVHPVLEALEARAGIDRVYVKKGLNNEVSQAVSEKARTANVPFQIVPREKLDRLAPGVNHQGVVAQSSLIKYPPLEDVIIALQSEGKDPFMVLLDGVTDVHNFGAIARSAECLGAHGLVIPEQGAARVNATAIKISAGALNHLYVSRVKAPADAIMLMQAYNMKVVSITEKADKDIYATDLSGPLCIVMGAEDKGIRKKLIGLSDDSANIPMTGKVGSLNVSVAAGIALAEAQRQRS